MENSPVSGLRMWRRIFNLDCYRGSLRSSRFLSFPGRDRTRERKSGRAKKHAWREQNIGEKWRGGEREGAEGGGREKESLAVNPKRFTKLRLPTNGEE